MSPSIFKKWTVGIKESPIWGTYTKCESLPVGEKLVLPDKEWALSMLAISTMLLINIFAFFWDEHAIFEKKKKVTEV